MATKLQRIKQLNSQIQKEAMKKGVLYIILGADREISTIIGDLDMTTKKAMKKEHLLIDFDGQLKLVELHWDAEFYDETVEDFWEMAEISEVK